MPVKSFKPTSPGRRGGSGFTFEGISRSRPEQRLARSLQRKGGRNNQGVITMRHRGGGSRRRYRLIDFRRDKRDIPGRVSDIQYDPNRSARVALIFYPDGEKRYILAPEGLRPKARIVAGEGAEIQAGNALPLRRIPVGTVIHNLELRPGGGGQMVRSAGTGAQLMAKEGGMALVRLPSGEMRRFHLECYATIGQMGNQERAQIKLGKAGRSRWLGRRPRVRGSAMNVDDHPHGGGEGRSPIGMPGPKTPWGKPARGVRTRPPKRQNQFIVRRRDS